MVELDEEYGLAITAPSSKARKFGPAPTLYVAGIRNHPLDPVDAWRTYLRVNELRDSRLRAFQAFSFLGAQCRQPMLHGNLVNAAKDMAGLLGVTREAVSGHSFCREGASFAYQAGVPDLLIQ